MHAVNNRVHDTAAKCMYVTHTCACIGLIVVGSTILKRLAWNAALPLPTPAFASETLLVARLVVLRCFDLEPLKHAQKSQMCVRAVSHDVSASLRACVDLGSYALNVRSPRGLGGHVRALRRVL